MSTEMLTVPEVAAFLRIGRSEAYSLAARGELPVLRIGRRVIVPRDALISWVAERTELARLTSA